jgi:hypothetical protein
MQMKLISGLILCALCVASCQVNQTVPSQTTTLRLCAPPDAVASASRRHAAEYQLSFHYGTHEASFGTSLAIRMISDEYEIEIINSDDDQYFVSLYMRNGAAENPESVRIFTRIGDLLNEEMSCSRSDMVPRPSLYPVNPN